MSEEAMKVWNAAVAANLETPDEPYGASADSAAAVIAAAMEADKADAARYRWLRDHSCPPHNFYISVPDEFHGVRYSPAEVDAYIDDALGRLKAKDSGDGR